MSIDEGGTVLKSRARRAIVALAVFAASSIALDLIVYAFPLNTAGNEAITLAVSLAFLCALVTSIIFVGMWIHRANLNLRQNGISELKFTPGWAVGWYFIPFANLVMPFRAMREIWNASLFSDRNLEESDPLLTRWWAFWLGGNIVSNVASRLDDGTGSGAAFATGFLGSLLLAGAAFSLYQIITAVTAAQTDRLRYTEVFA